MPEKTLTSNQLLAKQYLEEEDFLDIAYAGTIRTASRFTSGHSAGVDSDS